MKWLVFLLCQSLKSVYAGFVQEKKGSKFPISPLKLVPKTSLVQCVARCKRTQGCKSVNHQHLEDVCELLNEGGGKGDILETDHKWNHYVVRMCLPRLKAGEGKLLHYHQKLTRGLNLREWKKYALISNRVN